MMTGSAPETRVSLIVRLKDWQDSRAWSAFLDIYEPLVLQLVRANGLQDSDARDVTQQVLAAVAKDVDDWRPDNAEASFRRWLFRIARNRVLKFLAARRRKPQAPGGTDMLLACNIVPAPDGPEVKAFEHEYRQQVLCWAAEQIHSEFHEATWQAFWKTWVENRAVADVADELGLSVGSVYLARSRIVARLREKVREVEAE